MKKLTIITAILFTATLLMGQIINIPVDYPTIQQGINAASMGDTVLVQPGTYYENINFNGMSVTLASLVLTTLDTSYISQTIIIGKISIESYTQPLPRFHGFTVTNSESSGIYCTNSTIEIENVRVYGCNYIFGGIAITDSSTCYLKNVTIKNNIGLFGGGIAVGESSATLENVIISGNLSEWGGGGINCWSSNLVCSNVTISDNIAGDTIYGNDGNGGGIFCSESNILFQNGVINGNSTYYYGGGIYCYGSSPIFQNVLMSGNTCIGSNGTSVLHCLNDSHPLLHNVTITGNEQYAHPYGDYVGLIYCEGNTSNVSIANSIIYDNNDWPYSVIDDATAIYSNIEGIGSMPGEGNISEDPFFWGSGDHPYQLSGGSPCIDAGTSDTTGLNLPWLDLMDNYRMWDGDFDSDTIVDMGAYEFGSIGVGIEEDQAPKAIGAIFKVQCFPNPFSSSTSITFDLPELADVSIQIFNSTGKNVSSCFGGALPENQVLPAGKHIIQWNTAHLREGIYFCRLQAGSKVVVKKMIKN